MVQGKEEPLEILALLPQATAPQPQSLHAVFGQYAAPQDIIAVHHHALLHVAYVDKILLIYLRGDSLRQHLGIATAIPVPCAVGIVYPH